MSARAVAGWLVLGCAVSAGCTTEFKVSPDTSSDTQAEPDLDPGDTVEVPCSTDGDCDNGLRCDGLESCGADGYCDPGVPPDCSDGDPCTADLCVEEGDGCEHPPYDGDGDGFGAARLGDGTDCPGDDCNDEDGSVHPGAEEICNLVDEDCDGSILTAAGADDDGDGVLDAECGGEDCDDENDLVHGAFVPGPGITDPAVEPQREECDGLDNDCLGGPDDAEWYQCVQGTIVTCDTICGLQGTGLCMDCQIPPADECMEPAEICNGISDDCDDVVDEGVLTDASIDDFPVGILDGEVWHPRACFDGDLYGVVWVEPVTVSGLTTVHVHFALVEPDGSVAMDPFEIGSFASASMPPPNAAVACAPGRFGVVVNEPSDTTATHRVQMHSLDSIGGYFYGPFTVNETTSHPMDSVDVAFDPATSQWAVVWSTPSRNEVRLRRVHLDGYPIGSSPSVLASTSAAVNPRGARVARDVDGEMGVAWYDGRNATEGTQVVLRKVGTGPVVPGVEILVSAGDPLVTHLDMASSGTNDTFRLVWSAGSTTSDLEVFTAGVRAATTAVITDGPTMISPAGGDPSDRPSIDLWDARAEFVVSWSEFGSTYGAAIVRLSVSGAMLDGPYDPVSPVGMAYHPDVVAGPGTDDIAVFWDDGRSTTGTSFDVYMDFLGCN